VLLECSKRLVIGSVCCFDVLEICFVAIKYCLDIGRVIE
jgi:hypothetical protein